MKQVKYFDTYNNGKIKRYCVDGTEQYRQFSKILKHSDKDTVISYIEFDDGTSAFTDDYCNLLNIKIADKTQQATEKSLSDFRKLSALDKYKECVHYGNPIVSTDMNTTDGFLSFKIFEIYGVKFEFILLSGDVLDCYELQ